MHFKIGLLVPIPKGTKDKTCQDNHRGLTLISVFSKMYEKCINKRFTKWSKDNNLINDVQGSGKDKCSSIETAWLVKEVICHNIEQCNTVYVCLLDAKKAFDTVWQAAIFYKLYNLGLRGKTWRIIYLLYQNFKCKIKLAGNTSDEFYVRQSIHQGAPLSMELYCIYNNALLNELQNCIFGPKICDTRITCAAYADDVTLLTTCVKDMQYLVDIAYNYSLRWRFEYNPQKCKIMVFGNTRNLNCDIRLGSNVITVSKCETHLGVPLAVNMSDQLQSIKERVTSCKYVCYGISSLGDHNTPLSPIVATKLYKSVCLPKLCYGAAILDLNSECINTMESFHSNCSKMFQGLPVQSASPGSLGNLGWQSIEAVIDLMRLMFMWKILTLPMTCI